MLRSLWLAETMNPEERELVIQENSWEWIINKKIRLDAKEDLHV